MHPTSLNVPMIDVFDLVTNVIKLTIVWTSAMNRTVPHSFALLTNLNAAMELAWMVVNAVMAVLIVMTSVMKFSVLESRVEVTSLDVITAPVFRILGNGNEYLK